MKWQTKEQLLQLTKDLVGVESVSATPSEVNAGKYIYEQLSTLPYFKDNPENLMFVEVPGNFERKAVIAFLDKKQSKKTLLGVAHFDTVGLDDAGILKDVFTDPDTYTKEISKLVLDPESKKDLDSGEYLFARGIMDMKAGDALLMQCLEYYSNDDSFKDNLLFSFVGDEETNSEGVLAAVSKLAQLIEEKQLEPIACIDTEPDFSSYPNDDNKYIYIGTVGKLLGGFFVQGKETHVGESLSGLNSHLILANIVRKMELSTEFSEKVGVDVTLPPTSLKLEDHKRLYNVQTPLTGHVYYNLQTFKDSPKVYLDKMMKVAKEAIEESYQHVLEQSKTYQEMANLPLEYLKLTPQVFQYDEFYNEVKKEYPNIDELLVEKINELKPLELDERDLTIALIQELQRLSSNKNPKVVVFFAPPYYPHVSMNPDNPRDKKVIDAGRKTIEFAKKEYDIDIKEANYFQGLCDLSYFALEDAEDVLGYLKPNMPTLDKTYQLPLDAIAKINVPVINYGPHGRDAHKYTERILVDYSFETVPVVLKELISNLFKN